MISARQLTAGYGDRVVLDRLSLRFRERRTCAVLGPGGSGKSTLLHALAGACDGSELWVEGPIVPAGVPLARLRQRGPGESPGAPLAARLAVGGTDAADGILRRCWGAAPEVAGLLRPWLDAAPDVLPAELARLADLTAVFARGAPLLLLDEPDARLPEALVEAVARQLHAMRGAATLVVVTHNLAFARRVADDVILMVDGTVVEAGEAPRFFESPTRRRTADFLRWGA